MRFARQRRPRLTVGRARATGGTLLSRELYANLRKRFRKLNGRLHRRNAHGRWKASATDEQLERLSLDARVPAHSESRVRRTQRRHAQQAKAKRSAKHLSHRFEMDLRIAAVNVLRCRSVLGRAWPEQPPRASTDGAVWHTGQRRSTRAQLSLGAPCRLTRVLRALGTVPCVGPQGRALVLKAALGRAAMGTKQRLGRGGLCLAMRSAAASVGATCTKFCCGCSMGARRVLHLARFMLHGRAVQGARCMVRVAHCIGTGGALQE